MVYEFAGLTVDIDFRYSFGKLLCERYACEQTKKADFSVRVTDDMIAFERQIDPHGSSDGALESVAAYRLICDKALAYDCLFMHCSALSYKGNGVLFTAPSGTGKSTHAALWRKVFGDDVVMVNDDKPFLRLMDDTMYVCGTPWDGKHHISNNIQVPIKAIVILSQGKQNHMERATKQEMLYHLLNQTNRPEDPALMGKVLALCEMLIKTVPCYKLSCNISRQAVETAYEMMKENFNED